MLRIVWIALGALPSAFRSRRDLLLEVLALRQQLAAFKARSKRPRIGPADRAFWVVLRRLWARWADALAIVKPETVVRWHRASFRLYWNWISRRGSRRGRPRVDADVRDLIRQMACENGWGAPRIQGELTMLGLDVSERTVSRYLRCLGRRPESRQSWLTFLRNHREVIAATKAMSIKPTRTAYRSPWQNGAAERWVGCCRQELLDHVIVLGETHLRRLLREYVAYHHDDRTHCGLEKQTPMRRAVQGKPSVGANVIALPRLGGLHHRYEWRDAA